MKEGKLTRKKHRRKRGSIAAKLYWSFIAAACTDMIRYVPVFAADDTIWSRFSDIMKDIYGEVIGFQYRSACNKSARDGSACNRSTSNGNNRNRSASNGGNRNRNACNRSTHNGSADNTGTENGSADNAGTEDGKGDNAGTEDGKTDYRSPEGNHRGGDAGAVLYCIFSTDAP